MLITNATTFHVKQVAQTVDFLMQNGGEVWAKLDAGTEEFYQKISRSHVPFERVLQNITKISQKHPIWIQTLFLAENGIGPSTKEIGQYIAQLQNIRSQQGCLHGVQVYTVARDTPDPRIASLENGEIDRIADRIRVETGLTVRTFYSR